MEPSPSKKIVWESLDGENGASLQRLETPSGWVIEGDEGYLDFVPDPNKKWLASDDG
jgi:hypothetical protein